MQNKIKTSTLSLPPLPSSFSSSSTFIVMILNTVLSPPSIKATFTVSTVTLTRRKNKRKKKLLTGYRALRQHYPLPPPPASIVDRKHRIPSHSLSLSFLLNPHTLSYCFRWPFFPCFPLLPPCFFLSLPDRLAPPTFTFAFASASSCTPKILCASTLPDVLAPPFPRRRSLDWLLRRRMAALADCGEKEGRRAEPVPRSGVAACMKRGLRMGTALTVAGVKEIVRRVNAARRVSLWRERMVILSRIVLWVWLWNVREARRRRTEGEEGEG